MADFELEGRRVDLPCIVREASSLTATFLVPTSAAQALLADEALSLVEFLPGRTLLSLACIDYRDNDLGDYQEVSIAFFVRRSGERQRLGYLGAWRDFMRGRVATYIHRLPVNQSFTCEAGRQLWGFPKTVEDIEFAVHDGRVTCSLRMDGQQVFSLSAKAGGKAQIPETDMCTYSYIEGVLHATPFQSSATEVGFGLGNLELELGDHPVADELRSLGLPKRPLMTLWMGHMRGRFEAAARVD
jgi:hypothetical protein